MKEELEKLKSGEEKIIFFNRKEEEENEEKMPKSEEKHVEVEEGEGNAHLGTFAILEAIYKGRSGFGEGEQKKRPKLIKKTEKRIFDKICSHLWKIIKSIERKIWLENLWFVRLFTKNLIKKTKNNDLIDEKEEFEEIEQILDENFEKLKSLEKLGKTSIEQKILIEISEKSKKLEDNLIEELDKLPDIKLKEKRIEEFKKDDDEMHKEFRGRLGAQILLSVFNAKEVTKEIANSMLINLAGSGLISTILDVFVWPPLLAIVAISCPPLYIPLSVILYSVITNLFINIADSLFLQRFLIMMEGGNFTPTTLEGFLNNLKDSWNVKNIAVGGSLLNNLIQMDTNWDMLGLDILSNEIASSTSSAILPFEYSVMKDLLRAGVYYKYKKGFFPKPSIEQLVLERRIEENSKNKQICKEIVQKLFVINKRPHSLTSELGITNEERNVAFSKYIKHKVSASMDIEKNSSMTINAMGIGAVLSLFEIIGILFNPSTKLLKFGIGYITANHFGSEFFENFWSTDTIKNKEMIRLIFDRSIKRLNGKNKNLVEITEKEVYDIYHPKMTITYGYGKGVVRIMNWMKRKLKKGYAFLTGKKFKLKLFEQINLSKIALDLFNEEEIEDSGFFQAKLDDLQLKMREMPGMDTDKWESFYEETYKYIYEDGFSLADSSFMGINMLEMPGMVRQSKEWAELYNDALDRFYMHKLTFTEAHHILVSVSEPVLAKYIPRDRTELTY
uniref:Uncharacterized protein n=1 Tax=Meloidogyne javanica TaxID=6303 RepID=A0A915LQU8_MELJA